MKRFLAATLAATIGLAAPALAQTCGGTYTVQRGDSLSLIADAQYKNVGMWSEIHRNNLSSIGENPNSIRVGMRLRLGCINGLPTGLADGTPVAAAAAAPVVTPAAAPAAATSSGRALENTINIVTAGDYAPFTDKSLEGEGLMTELVNTAMQGSGAAKGYRVHWVNDWSSHLDPLMTSAMMDMAFPWVKPDCVSSPEEFRCQNFHFSDPMFEMLILLFVDKTRPVPFATDADIHGRTLCRPAGYFIHDLDRFARR
ncbi:MAG: LysM peptidoglycan-binding domain-containing protein [Pseudomonadota bacterium]